MTRTTLFKSIYCSRSLCLLLLGGLVFVLQTGDNVSSSARAFTTPDDGRSAKADRWLGPDTRPGIYGTRLVHLWDGTPEERLKQMAAPKGDRIMLAYAPEMLPQTDASRELMRFDNQVEVVPQPKPRPAKELAAQAQKIGAPLNLTANFPKPTLQKLEQPAPTQPEVKLASLAPDTLPMPDTTQAISLKLPFTPQIASVQTGCFPEKLVSFMQAIEGKFRKKVVVTSGFRDHGRLGSLHMHCAAADIVVPGIAAKQLASFVKTLPEIGGVGTYCHPWMIHIDVGHRRDWNFGCRAPAKKGPKKDEPKQTVAKETKKS
jgi:hypothetical protein